ncbi:MAG: DNA primase [Oscillospiraceae bacterium]|nr:DNA primase [Oscillospiraceae bacterium]
MAIPAAYIQELSRRNDIYDVVSTSVSLKRAGRLYKGLCPFHSERTPSFMVYPDTQSFYCFGCGKGGDVIKFTMEINNLTYIEAVRLLAERSGMPLPDEDDGQARLKSRILEMNKLAARFFFDNLNSEKGKDARKYLRERMLRDKTIVNFGLGYAPNEWDALYRYLISKGFTEDEITAAYLARRSSNGRAYDIFRNRVMFPIIDLRGNVIAFGGRRLADSDNGPKYLNSGDTPVFKKSNGLFALNLAKKSGSRRFILCEGYMDVIAMHRAGFNYAVATLGTALTQNQAKLISDYADKVIIAYDSDEAGQKATKRAMEIFSREDIGIQVLRMEGAKDPDEYIKKFGAERFEMLIEGANTALDYSIAKLRKNYDISDPTQRAEYLNKACDVLAGMNDTILQDVYCSRLAEETGTDKAAIKTRLDRSIRRARRQQAGQRQAAIDREGIAGTIKVDWKNKTNTLNKTFLQQQIICAMVKENHYYGTVSEKLNADSFTDSDMREAYTAFSDLISQGISVDYSTLSYYLSDSARQTLAMVFARNADTVIGERDVDMYINNLLTAKMSQSEIGEKSLDELKERLDRMREKKK